MVVLLQQIHIIMIIPATIISYRIYQRQTIIQRDQLLNTFEDSSYCFNFYPLNWRSILWSVPWLKMEIPTAHRTFQHAIVCTFSWIDNYELISKLQEGNRHIRRSENTKRLLNTTSNGRNQIPLTSLLWLFIEEESILRLCHTVIKL
jgi:hypothetical protein